MLPFWYTSLPRRRAFTPAEFPTEWGVALLRRGFCGPDHEGLLRVDQRQVGIEAHGDVALAVQAVALRRIPGEQFGHVVVGHAALRSSAHHAREQVLGAAEPGLRQPDVFRVVLVPLLLGGAAGVIADDPVDIAVEHGFPQGFHILARADGRIHLGLDGAFAVDVEQQVADGDFAPEIDVRKHILHHQRGIDGLLRGQVQQVDVRAVGLVGEVGGDPDRQSLGVGRARGAVRLETLELALALNQLGVSGEDFGQLAVQADADGVGHVRCASIIRRAERMMNSKCDV